MQGVAQRPEAAVAAAYAETVGERRQAGGIGKPGDGIDKIGQFFRGDREQRVRVGAGNPVKRQQRVFTGQAAGILDEGLVLLDPISMCG
jgi:hypothetical protein